jgi:hypothetical protein
MMIHEEERQGKEVYNWKEEAGSSEWLYLFKLCHITLKKYIIGRRKQALQNGGTYLLCATLHQRRLLSLYSLL